jgi:twinkle protein
MQQKAIMKTKTNGLPCPCGKSSDAYAIQDNGWGKCFSCGRNFPPEGEEALAKPNNTEGNTKGKREPISPLAEVSRPLPARGFTEETVSRYKVTVGKEGDRFVAKYPLFSPEGEHIGNKIRMPTRVVKKEDGTEKKVKDFPQEGEPTKAGLFGRHAFNPGSAKAITVCEGQDDAMAAFQMMGGKYPVVAVHSASSAEKDVQKDFEYLNSFDQIYICMDADEQGKKAAKAIAGAGFPLGKVRIVNLRKHKDPNDYLLNKDSAAFTKEWWQAEAWKPDGLKLGSDMWQEIINRKESFTVNYPFEGLNRLTYGLRLSELVTITADTGVGKTALLKHIEQHLLTNEEVKENGYGIGLLHLEEPNGDTALGLLSVHNSVPYHIPGIERNEADLRKAYDELLNNDRVVIWDHFGSNSVDAVVAKVRHMAALGCRYIVIDHLSIIVSDQSGDERKQLDEIATKLKTITMELDLAIIAVIHINRQGQIRGTAGVEQLSNIVVRLERNKTDPSEWRRNVTKVTVEKNRFCGYTGPACYLYYNKDTGRLTELSQEHVEIYEAGDALNDDELPF